MWRLTFRILAELPEAAVVEEGLVIGVGFPFLSFFSTGMPTSSIAMPAAPAEPPLPVADLDPFAFR